MLRAPIVGSVASAAGGPTVLLAALTAALVARMESLPIAVFAAIGLGAAEQVVEWNWSAEPVSLLYLG
ncbi:MAG: hypothetical protein R2698_11270 [Microthrixaceae bacterium]